MNLVRSLYYFIYWDILLLTSFRRVDGYNNSEFFSQEIADIVQPTNVENNTAQRTEGEFTWFCEKDPEKRLTRFNSAWNFVR